MKYYEERLKLIHFNEQIAPQIEKFSKPFLKMFDFDTFRYALFDRESVFFIANKACVQRSILERFDENGFLFNQTIRKTSPLKNQTYIWPSNPEDVRSDKVLSYFHAANMWNGISFLFRRKNCVEGFCFSRKRNSSAISTPDHDAEFAYKQFTHDFKTKFFSFMQTEFYSLKSPIDWDEETAKCLPSNKVRGRDALRKNGPGTAFSCRQTEVLFYLNSGLSLKEVSSRLGISIATVKFHLQQAKDKLKCDARKSLLDKFSQEFSHWF